MYDGMEYIVIPHSSPENITYMCTANGTILWQFGGCDENKVSYQMVDRDEFLNNGIVIQDAMIGLSMLTLRSSGRMFLSSMLQSDVFTVQCLAVLNDVNVYGGPVYTIELDGMLVGGPIHNVCTHICMYIVYMSTSTFLLKYMYMYMLWYTCMWCSLYSTVVYRVVHDLLVQTTCTLMCTLVWSYNM